MQHILLCLPYFAHLFLVFSPLFLRFISIVAHSNSSFLFVVFHCMDIELGQKLCCGFHKKQQVRQGNTGLGLLASLMISVDLRV